MFLIGQGVTRTAYELIVDDRKTHAHLFNIRVEGTEQAFAFRAQQAGTNSDAQAVSAAFQVASRIIDTNAFKHGQRYQLELRANSSSFREA